MDTAAHLAANDDAAMAFVQQAVADNGVLTALFQLHAKEYLAGLHGNAVVAHVDVHADDGGDTHFSRCDEQGEYTAYQCQRQIDKDDGADVISSWVVN